MNRTWPLLALGLALASGCANSFRANDGGRGDTQRPMECGALTTCRIGCVDVDVDPEHCGGCDRTCVVPHAIPACVGGVCAVDSCAAGYSDCNASADDGCEHADSCTQDGGCTTSCGTMGALDCANLCAPVCVAPAEACNAVDDDCDGACETGLGGCRRGVHRSSGAGGHFYSVDAGEAGCCGFTVEALNYYYLYTSGYDGLQPLFRCIAGDGHHYYTTDTAADMMGGIESQMGFIAMAPRCGAVPLHRLRNAAGDHFYTVSDGERDSAIGLGYVYVGITGYVWLAP